jgi:hypothetical protein
MNHTACTAEVWLLAEARVSLLSATSRLRTGSKTRNDLSDENGRQSDHSAKLTAHRLWPPFEWSALNLGAPLAQPVNWLD